jgi:hypothetical protein
VPAKKFEGIGQEELNGIFQAWMRRVQKVSKGKAMETIQMINSFYRYWSCSISSDEAGVCTYQPGDIGYPTAE